MKDKLEQIFDKHHEGFAVYNKDEIIKELLVLFNVVGQSEQLPCDCNKYPTYFDESGKPRCKNCNERSWLAR
jgi:hypothetical protein